MSEIFISHAVADKALADKFVGFLKEAIGVPAKSIFCSSIDGQNIPFGSDFNEYMKNQIQAPKLVILLMTPRYMESWFCLMELGATWAKSHAALPIVVPPITFSAISSTLGLKQGWSIDNDAKLIDLRQMIKALPIALEERTEHDWEKKRAAWKADLKKVLKNLKPATSVSASDHKALQDEIEALKQELAALQEAYAEATDLNDELVATKDPAAVKAILAKRTGFDPEVQFGELIDEIKKCQPNVSIYFYRNVILDLYGKAVNVDWSDLDQKASAENAIQYNIMDSDPPYDYLWKGKKLQKVAAAVKALEEFLGGDRATDFVKAREDAGRTMELDDLEFWEDNLR